MQIPGLVTISHLQCLLLSKKGDTRANICFLLHFRASTCLHPSSISALQVSGEGVGSSSLQMLTASSLTLATDDSIFVAVMLSHWKLTCATHWSNVFKELRKQ